MGQSPNFLPSFPTFVGLRRVAEAPFSNDDYHDFKYYDHDDDNDFEADRIWGKAKRVRGDTEEAAKAVGGHSGIVLKSFVCLQIHEFCVDTNTNTCRPSKYVKGLVSNNL